MSVAAERPAKRQPVPLNGVNTPVLLATVNAVGAQPDLAKFQFRASNRWQNGTHNVGRFESFFGAGTEHTHKTIVNYDFDHPAVLVGDDHGPTPVEFLLIALAGCLTSGIANIAAARGVTLTDVTSTVIGDIDLRGILGLSPDVRNGFQNIRVDFSIKGDAMPDKLRAIVEQSRARSAVFDMLTKGTTVEVSVNAG
jgi:uncharacterized OsmC-like protein